MAKTEHERVAPHASRTTYKTSENPTIPSKMLKQAMTVIIITMDSYTKNNTPHRSTCFIRSVFVILIQSFLVWRQGAMTTNRNFNAYLSSLLVLCVFLHSESHVFGQATEHESFVLGQRSCLCGGRFCEN